MFGCGVFCQPERSSFEKELVDGIFGNVARDNVKRLKVGGLVDGNAQLPMRNGDVVENCNSPDTVNPKLS